MLDHFGVIAKKSFHAHTAFLGIVLLLTRKCTRRFAISATSACSTTTNVVLGDERTQAASRFGSPQRISGEIFFRLVYSTQIASISIVLVSVVLETLLDEVARQHQHFEVMGLISA